MKYTFCGYLSKKIVCLRMLLLLTTLIIIYSFRDFTNYIKLFENNGGNVNKK